MKPTMQLRFEVRDEWDEKPGEMRTVRILQQLWVDDSNSTDEWRDVPQVEGWRDHR